VKLNKTGLKFCAVYLCYFVLLSIPELVTGDPKEGLLGQLSIAPFIIFGLLLVSVGLGDVIVYLTGWAISAFSRKMKSVKPDPSMPVVDPPGWSDRP